MDNRQQSKAFMTSISMKSHFTTDSRKFSFSKESHSIELSNEHCDLINEEEEVWRKLEEKEANSYSNGQKEEMSNFKSNTFPKILQSIASQ